MIYTEQYTAYQGMVEDALAKRMQASESPEPLKSAMQYSLLEGGKRLRPILLLAACDMAGGDMKEALPYACALEMIHTYSLIHDDLPAMDNDDYRRGRLTNHKVYGEGMAVLAGDGLLSMAFETMLNSSSLPKHIEAMRRIAASAGTIGMIAGQCVDIRCEKERAGGVEELLYIHLHKTADLFIGAITAGLILAEAPETQVQAGKVFAESMGLAFQIRDDLLDITGDAVSLGKATGKDQARGKVTWPGVYGVKAAERDAQEKTNTALAALEVFGDRAGFLQSLARQLLLRDR